MLFVFVVDIRCPIVMDDPFSKGFAFELGDIWRQSIFQAERPDESLFQLEHHVANFPELEPNDDHDYQLALELPDLSHVNGVEDHTLNNLENEQASPVTDPVRINTDSSADIWALHVDHDDRENLPRLRTWEAFDKKDVANSERTAYLSEAGPDAFDSALVHTSNREASDGVLPQDVVFRALCNLILGRSSIFFQWNAEEQAFFQSLKDVPISGYSLPACGSFVRRLIDFGSMYRILDDFASAPTPPYASCTALISFRGCVTSILDSVEEYIGKAIPRTHSLLQLQSLTERSRQLLDMLREMVRSVQDLGTDEEVIANLSDFVHRTASAENEFSEALGVMLSRVSKPWLERLCADLGLTGNPIDQGALKSENHEGDGIDDSSGSIGGSTGSPNALPRFVHSEDHALIKETKASLQVLRRHQPNQDLAVFKSTDFLQEHFHDEMHVAPMRAIRAGYEIASFPTRDASTAFMASPDRSIVDGMFTAADDYGGLAWLDNETRHEYLTTLDARISEPLETFNQGADRLRRTVSLAIESDASSAGVDTVAFSERTQFNPLERLRPLIQAHNRLINSTLLRHLFRKCRLQHHLDLQHQYHLLGNGDFVARLAKALFSADTQSAERRRGTLPTGETMGLRLGAREGQRWPPASSELRLTLMGVLIETYHPEQMNIRKTSNTKELPGGLSFSIRELPDKEIEKVLESGSIYALDFLRLQYTAPPAVDAILTPSSMQAYDSIFRFALRLLRVLHVTTMLRVGLTLDDSTWNSQKSGENAYSRTKARFAIEAQHFMSMLMSHVMDVGIAPPWQEFSSSLADVEKSLTAEDGDAVESPTLIGLDGLRQLHESCLESIRNRLFLRRKQEKIRGAIENVLTSILTCASDFESDEAGDHLDGLVSFEQSLIGFLSLLHTTVEKPLKVSAANNTAESDAEAVKLLSMRLNWNDFYAGST